MARLATVLAMIVSALAVAASPQPGIENAGPEILSRAIPPEALHKRAEIPQPILDLRKKRATKAPKYNEWKSQSNDKYKQLREELKPLEEEGKAEFRGLSDDDKKEVLLDTYNIGEEWRKKPQQPLSQPGPATEGTPTP